MLALAVVGGLAAVVAVQRRANVELAAEQAKVEARFELAQKAITTFHTGVSEDMLLRNDQFRELRTKRRAPVATRVARSRKKRNAPAGSNALLCGMKTLLREHGHGKWPDADITETPAEGPRAPQGKRGVGWGTARTFFRLS